MDQSEISRDIAIQLLKRSALSADEVNQRLESAADPAYWKSLNPGLSIGAEGSGFGMLESTSIGAEEREEIVQKFRKEGYFQAKPLLAEPALAEMRECVETLRKHRWPPVFAFVYDVFWQITRVPSLRLLLSQALGADYRQNSRLWCFYILPVSGAKGFPPHIDGANRLNRIIIWIPLSDATLENGCIYLVPQHLTPKSIGFFSHLHSVNRDELKALLQGARALPGKSGSVLGWHTELIHWGSTCGQPLHARISISVEFIGKNEQPAHDEPPLLDGFSLPPFALRLHAIGKGILDYEHYERGMLGYRELALRLVKQSA